MAKKTNRKTLKKPPASPPEVLPLLLFPAKSKSEEAWLTRLKKQKRIRKIGPRLYTSVSAEKTAAVVQGQWAHIISQLYPEALLSYRSALEFKPSPENQITLTSTTNRSVKLPGLTLNFIRGPKALSDDSAFMGFHACSQARAFLENLSVSKTTAKRALSRPDLEAKLENILRVTGESGLNQIRDRAREIAGTFAWQNEFEKLNQIIGALLGTRPSQTLASAIAKSRARGRAFDIARVARFDVLFAELRANPLKEFKDSFSAHDHFNNKAFFEAYFSNYIEGTTFEIKEAEEIVFDKKIPPKRPKDAHDILSTMNIVSDPNEMRKLPQTSEELESLLKYRHKVLMQQRPEAMPGNYKEEPNRAGDTHFVLPGDISGTLEKGFERYQELPIGLPRAIFMMFLVAEVHPFTDGNGRIARIMMNAELFSKGLVTIIIPTVYRKDYLTTLRALTRRDRPEPLVRMLARAQQFSCKEFSPYGKVLAELQAKNWFRESDEAKLID